MHVLQKQVINSLYSTSTHQNYHFTIQKNQNLKLAASRERSAVRIKSARTNARHRSYRNVEVTWKFSRTILVRNSSGQTSSIAHHREKRKEIKSINKHSTSLFTLWLEKTVHHKPKGILNLSISKLDSLCCFHLSECRAIVHYCR